MKSIRYIPFLFLFVLVLSTASRAQDRTFVSGLGNDVNPCTHVAPCRSFTQAISLTNPGGEVDVLDTAGYDPVTITKSVAIVAPVGVTAGVSVFAGNGITISAATTDTVILRGIVVNNQGSGGSGIAYTSGGVLHVESCIVNGFSTSGQAGLSFLGVGVLEVKDSILRSNSSGIQVATVGAGAVIDQVRLEGNGIGLVAGGGSVVTVRNSSASANGYGFYAHGEGGAVRLNLERCMASNNVHSGIVGQNLMMPGFRGSGTVDVSVESCVVAGNGSAGVASGSLFGSANTVRISNSTITGNGTGLDCTGGPAVLLTRGNNSVEANTINTSGTIGSYAAK